MTKTYDFTIKGNEGIRNYFSGNNSYVPIPEILYLHDRPLLRPNFLTEIQDLVEETGKYLKEKNITGYVLDKLSEYAITLANTLPDVTKDNAELVLGTLRDIRHLCKNTLPGKK